MKTDREMLKLAAKAAGYALSETTDAIWDDDTGEYVDWNPRDDDGDALRLAVDLDLRVDLTSGCVVVFTLDIDHDCVESLGTDKLAATRRAIVRAAAAIGESMP